MLYSVFRASAAPSPLERAGGEVFSGLPRRSCLTARNDDVPFCRGFLTAFGMTKWGKRNHSFHFNHIKVSKKFEVLFKIISDSVEGKIFVFDTVIVRDKSVNFSVELLGFCVGVSVFEIV